MAYSSEVLSVCQALFNHMIEYDSRPGYMGSSTSTLRDLLLDRAGWVPQEERPELLKFIERFRNAFDDSCTTWSHVMRNLDPILEEYELDFTEAQRAVFKSHICGNLN